MFFFKTLLIVVAFKWYQVDLKATDTKIRELLSKFMKHHLHTGMIKTGLLNIIGYVRI